MEVEKQQYLETFIHIVKNARSKNEFLKNVQDFDSKFTQAFQGANYQKKASYESFQSVQQIQPPQKPKNPFINPNEQQVKRNYSPNRSNNFIPPQSPYYNNANNMFANNQNKMNIQPSRSQQEFFKPPQASKTFHAGFGSREYEKPTYNNANMQQLNQFLPKGPQFAWQTAGQGFNQHQAQYSPQSHFEQQMKQNYNEMRRNFANFGVNDQQMKNQGSNIDLSINSHQNFNPINYGNDLLPSNEFLAAFSNDVQNNMAKYYKGPIPYGKQPENSTPRPYMGDKRMNPFGNQ